ncbi:MAG: hypothetical protein MZV64_19630 [Ignavibacteriales bacterium]|nr:hypothetical protein [Ignavibacteriales bacterium]
MNAIPYVRRGLIYVRDNDEVIAARVTDEVRWLCRVHPPLRRSAWQQNAGHHRPPQSHIHP